MAPLIEVRRAIEIGAAARRLAKASIAASESSRVQSISSALHPGVRPFVVGDGDAAVGAAQDRLDDHRVAEGLDVALALQMGLVGIDAARDVDGHAPAPGRLRFLSCAAAGQASRSKRTLRRSSMAMATSAVGAHDEARSVPPVGSHCQPRSGRPAAPAASLWESPSGKIAGGRHGSSAQPAGRGLPRRGAPLPRRES